MVEDGLVDSDEFEMAVDDVHWVLSHVIAAHLVTLPTN